MIFVSPSIRTVTTASGATAVQVVTSEHAGNRMSKSDLKARPIYARTEGSINAHLNIVMATLAVSRMMESATGRSIKRLVRTFKKYRSFELRVEDTTIHVATPLPAEVQNLVHAITEP